MTVWFLISTPRTDIGLAELNAAHYWLTSCKKWDARVFKPHEIGSTGFKPGDVIWCHVPCEDVSAAMHEADNLAALRGAVENGAGLVLSLTASTLPHAMGIEALRPDVVEAGRWRGETGFYAYRGFLAFEEHPLLNIKHRFRTRLHTWTPQDGEPWWRTVYSVEAPQRVIARGARYISFVDDAAAVWEYRVGEGAVVCIGAYAYFNARRNYQRHFVEMFLENCIEYASSHRTPVGEDYYWPKKNIGVREAGSAEEIALPEISINLKEEEYFVRKGMPSLPGNREHNLYSVAGRRILLTGFEGDRVAEVWSYPVRLLSDFTWTIRPDGKGSIPPRGMPSTTTVYPDAVSQQYEYSSYGVRELIGASIFKPAAYINLEIVAERPFTTNLRFVSDMAMMWPMPRGSCGAISHHYDAERRMLGWRTEHRGLWGCIFFSREPASVNVTDESTAEHSLMGVEIEFPLRQPGIQHLSIAIVGGGARVDIPNYDTRLALDSVLDVDRSGDHYRNMLKTMFQAETPEPAIGEGLRWAQLKMEAFRALTPGLGRGLTAGIAVSGDDWLSTRPGYAWYFGRDSMWTALALLTVGQWNVVEDMLRMLAEQQAPDGKIFHELSPSNYAHHDSADANLLFIIAAERYRAWTGDDRTIAEIKPALRAALEFSFNADRDGDCLTENTGVGHGWIEAGKLSGAHVTFYLAGLWLRALGAARILFSGDRDARWKERIELTEAKAHEMLRMRFWDEERSTYYHAILSDGTMQSADTIMPAPVILFGDTDPEQDRCFLLRSSGPDIVTDWGARMISDLDERYNPTGYHIGSVWPLYTGWLGLAQYKRGRYLQGFDLLHGGMTVCRDFSPGSFSEVLRGDVYDEIGVCPQQAWSAGLMIWLLTRGMLGLETANEGMMTVAPAMPPHWPDASFSNVRWADGYIDLHYRRNGCEVTWRIDGLEPGKRMTFAPRFCQGTRVGAVLINGEEIEPNIERVNDRSQLNIPMVGDGSEITITIRLDQFVSPAPALRLPQRGKPSRGYRIIDWARGTDSIWVELMDLCGDTGEIDFIDPLDLMVCGPSLVRIEGERKTISYSIPNSKEKYGRTTLRFTLKRPGEGPSDG